MDNEKLQLYLDRYSLLKLKDVVEQLIFDEILSLSIDPGSKLNVNQIAAQLGISRTPVAEAIAHLNERGFVVTKNDAPGYFVLSLNMADMINLYRTRGAIECEAAALCTERADNSTIQQLVSLADEFQNAVLLNDSRAMIETDMPFHELIVKASDDPYIVKTYELLKPNLTMYQASMLEYGGTKGSNPWSSSVIYNHTAIAAAIKMHIPDLAKQAMADHIDASLNFTMFNNAESDLSFRKI